MLGPFAIKAKHVRRKNLKISTLFFGTTTERRHCRPGLQEFETPSLYIASCLRHGPSSVDDTGCSTSFSFIFSFYLPIYIYLALLVRDDGQASLEHDVIIFFVN